MERALREGREGSHRLDLVAEELDPEGLAARGREDVDDAAAHRELAAVVHPLDPLVAGKRERLRQAVDAWLETGPQLDRLRARLCGRQPLGERPRGSADEPALCEHVERPCSLAHEVRRRREPRLPRDTATRQQTDLLVPEKPRGSFGGVAGVRVLRQENDEPTLEALVQRCQQKRQRRLRHTGARRQRLRKLAKALVLDELLDERMQYRTVHDEGRNRRVPRASMVTSRREAYAPGRARGRSLRAAERTAVQAALVRAHRLGGRGLAPPPRPPLGPRPPPPR